MKEFLMYIKMIKDAIDTYSLKETVFYDEGKWYSREHSRNIHLDELNDMLVKIPSNYHEQYEYLWQLEELVSERLGADVLEEFQNKFYDK